MGYVGLLVIVLMFISLGLFDLHERSFYTNYVDTTWASVALELYHTHGFPHV